MKSRKIPIAISIVMSVLAIVGWALHWHLTVNNVTQVPPKPQASGYMTPIDCASIKVGMKETAVVDIYSLPMNDTNADGSTDQSLNYPLKEDHNKSCTVYFDSKAKVNLVTIDLVGAVGG